jgi:hypothetical protein
MTFKLPSLFCPTLFTYSSKPFFKSNNIINPSFPQLLSHLSYLYHFFYQLPQCFPPTSPFPIFRYPSRCLSLSLTACCCSSSFSVISCPSSLSSVSYYFSPSSATSSISPTYIICLHILLPIILPVSSTYPAPNICRHPIHLYLTPMPFTPPFSIDRRNTTSSN